MLFNKFNLFPFILKDATNSKQVLPAKEDPDKIWNNRREESEAFFNTMYPVADRCAEHVLKGKIDREQLPTAQVQTTLQIMQTFMQLWVAMKLKNL